MLKFAYKNYNHRKKASKNALNINTYRSLLLLVGNSKLNINVNVWKYLIFLKSYFVAFSSFSRTRSVCPITGRTRGIYRMFRLSRLKIREHAGFGMFIGISKTSW